MPPPSIDLSIINDATFITLDVWDRALLKDLSTLTDRLKTIDPQTTTNNSFRYIQTITTRLREIQAIHRVASRHMLQRIERLEEVVMIGMSEDKREDVTQFLRNDQEESTTNERAPQVPTLDYDDSIIPSIGSSRPQRTDKLPRKFVSTSDKTARRLPSIPAIEVDDRYMMSGALQDD